MKRYSYKGPVMEFYNCVQRDWAGETMADSDKKAINNLAYQWKKDHNRCAGAKVRLPGRLTIVE